MQVTLAGKITTLYNPLSRRIARYLARQSLLVPDAEGAWFTSSAGGNSENAAKNTGHPKNTKNTKNTGHPTN
jgi:hypothetical protein